MSWSQELIQSRLVFLSAASLLAGAATCTMETTSKLGAISDPGTKAPGQDEHTQRAALTTSIFISLGRKIAGKVKLLAASPSKQSAEYWPKRNGTGRAKRGWPQKETALRFSIRLA